MEKKQVGRMPLVFYLIVGALATGVGILTRLVMRELDPAPEGGGIAYALFMFVFGFGMIMAIAFAAVYLAAAVLKFLQMRFRFRWPAYLCITFDIVMILVCISQGFLLWILALIQLLVLIDNVKSAQALRKEKMQEEDGL